MIERDLRVGGVGALADIAADRARGLEAVGLEFQRLAGDLAVIEAQFAAQFQVRQQGIDLFAEAAQAVELRLDGDDDGGAVLVAAALRVEAAQADVAVAEAFGGDVVIDARRLEGAVEHQIGAQAVGADVLAERVGPQQARVRLQLSEAVVAEIDHAQRLDVDGLRGQRQVQVEHAVLHLRRGVDIELRPEQGGGVRAGDQVRVRRSGDMKHAVLRRQLQVAQRRAAEFGDEAAPPQRPAALAVEIEAERLAEAQQPVRRAVLRRQGVRFEVELVGVRHGVEAQGQPVALVAERLQRRLRAPAQDMRRAAEAQRVGLARHRRVEDERADLHAVQVDAQVGQDRAGLFRRLRRIEDGLAQHLDARRVEVADVDMFVQIAERAPVKIDDGRLDEHALRVHHAQAVDGHLAVQRAVDAVDLELQAGIELDPGGELHQQAAARRGVERGQKRGQQQQNRRRDRRRAPEDAAPADVAQAEPGLARQGFGGRLDLFDRRFLRRRFGRRFGRVVQPERFFRGFPRHLRPPRSSGRCRHRAPRSDRPCGG